MSKLENLLGELTSGDEERAENAIPALLDLGQAAIPALQDLLKSEDVDQRWWAIRVISQSPLGQCEWLTPFLDDPAVEIRQAAALGLSNHPDEAAIQPLIQALSDSDALVSNLATHALVSIGALSVSALMDVPAEAPLAARINALRALAEIKDYRAIPTLMAALDQDSALLQYWAEEGLERLGLNMVYVNPE
jgi:HEAT repeat protein